jgi:uroporphyrinogen-III decarboxylase
MAFSMTPRQRLLHVLAGEPTDRVPVWLLFPYHPTGYYVDVRTHPTYRRVFDAALEHGVIMLNRRNLAVRLHAPCVVYEEERGEAGQRRIMRHGATRVYAEGGKKLLASDEDLAAFCELPIEDDPGTLAAALESQLGKYRQEQTEFPLDGGAMMLDLGSPVNTLYHAAVLEEFSIWSLTQAPLIEQWLERRLEQLEFVYRFCLERDLADVYFLVGSELAAPPLVSRQTFQRWVMPYESRLISLVHSYGKRVIQHFHGQIRELLPDFLAMQPDALHTIEAPPVGNCTLTQAYEGTGEQITLIGNIQYDDFRSATPADMRQCVRETLDEVAGRRFILSPTAGPFDPAPPARLIDNYLAFIQAATEFCT